MDKIRTGYRLFRQVLATRIRNVSCPFSVTFCPFSVQMSLGIIHYNWQLDSPIKVNCKNWIELNAYTQKIRQYLAYISTCLSDFYLLVRKLRMFPKVKELNLPLFCLGSSKINIFLRGRAVGKPRNNQVILDFPSGCNKGDAGWKKRFFVFQS